MKYANPKQIIHSKKECIILTVLIFLVTLSSCSNKNKRLEKALEFAGNNRVQLETVLEHYRAEKDSLKLKAAIFLISNMPYYYSYQGPQLDTIKKLLVKGDFNQDILNEWGNFPYNSLRKIYDSKVITAQYLIENIDLSFEIWESRPWSKFYSFQDFCNYILPYRIADEPLEKWKYKYYNKFQKILDSLYKGNDVIEASSVITSYMKKEGFHRIDQLSYPHLGASFLFNHPIGVCREACDLGIYVMRSMGIPLSIYKYFISPVYLSKHFWNSLIDTNGKTIPFIYNELDISRTIFDGRRRGKVYRQTFEDNLSDKKNENDSLPLLFQDRHLKDVTADYYGYAHNEFEVKIYPTNEKYVYLSVFNGIGWEPIDISLFQRDKARFSNVEDNLIYQSKIYLQNTNLPVGFPFILLNGKPQYLIPDLKNLSSINLTRKYPLLPWVVEHMKYFAGFKVELASDEALKKEAVQFKIDTPRSSYNEINVNSKSVYKFLRLTSPPDKILELAELHVYKPDGNEILAEIKGEKQLNELRTSLLPLIQDQNPLSFYMSQDKGEKLIFSFATPSIVNKITYYTRNDDNYVKVGDTYELFYQAGFNGWKSLGKQLAKSRTLKYQHVPANALLWLHDLSEGQEEEVFIYHNDKQLFANDLNIKSNK
jgi:hypothetical protein